MTEKEIYKEKVIVHHEPAAHVEHVYHEEPDRRHDFRSRGVVRNEILSFRRGVYTVLDIVVILLVVEFFIKLMGLSGANPFVTFMDAITYPLIAPFGSLVSWVTPFFAINWSIFVAIIVYGILAYLFVALFESGIRSAYRRNY